MTLSSMRIPVRLILLGLIACLSLGVFGMNPDPQPASAMTNNQEVNALAMAIDNRLSMSGLPGGNGVISPTESAISEVIWTDINSFNTGLNEFEQASPANTAAIDDIEITVSDYYIKVFDPSTRPAAELDLQQQLYLQNREGVDTAFLDQLTKELTSTIGLPAQPDNPQLAQAKYELLQLAMEILFENGAATPQQIGNAIKNGTSDYVQNDNNIKRKNINRKRIENIIEFYVPSQMLPTNGLWKAQPFNMQMTGPCADLDTYCDGCGGADPGNEEDQDPGEPLCGFENPGGLPFITWQYAMHMYLPGTPSIYSDMPEISYTTTQDSNGQTTGSQRSERYVEYEVVSPDRIIVHYREVYEGGCTYSADYEIVLVTADESVCPDLSGYDPTQDDSEPTPVEIVPGEEAKTPPFEDDDPAQEETEQPPVQAGPYKVGLPLMPVEEACVGVIPELTEVSLLDQGNGSIVVDYGSGQHTVYRTGLGFYIYDAGMGGAGRENLSLSVFGDGTGSLFWSKNDGNGLICSSSQDIYLPGTGPEAPVEAPVEAPTDPDAPIMPANVPLEEGSYNVEWMVLEGLCPADMQNLLPNFAEMTLTYVDATTLILDYADGQYTLTDMTGTGQFMVVNTDGGFFSLAVAAYEDGTAYIGMSVMPEGSEATCSASATITLE